MMGVFYLVFVVLLPTSAPPGCSEIAPPGATPDQVKGSLNCRIYNHFAAFMLIGLLAWNFTASSVSTGLNSLLGNSSIIKKVYFPREVFPISSVLAQLVNFALALIPLFFVMLASGILPSAKIFYLPVILFFQTMFLVGLAMFFSVLALYFRDLLVIMEVLLQAWFFLSPIFYSMDQVYKEAAQVVYWVNPMASYIEIYRSILFFNYPPDPAFMFRTFLSSFITLVVGYGFFMYRRKNIGQKV